MLSRNNLFVAIGLIMLVSVSAAAFAGGGTSDADPDYDLAAALDSAASGSRIILSDDAVLKRDATVKKGVVLEDSGFSLTIQEGVRLHIEGTLSVTGELFIEAGSRLYIESGGLMNVDSGINTAKISGAIEIKKGGTANIGRMASSTLDFSETGILFIDGAMNIGFGSSSSTVNVYSTTVTGELRLSSGSNFIIKRLMVVGEPLSLTTDRNDTIISGRVTTIGPAFILVYGESSFSTAHIKNSSVSTKFMLQGKTYATEYGDSAAKPNIVIPQTSELKDYRVTAWKDSSGQTVTDSSGVKIGSGDITADAVKQTYKITFTDDKSIRWIVNGAEKGSSFEENAAYGTTYTVDIRSAPGYRDLPFIFKDGDLFTAGSSFTVTENTVFTIYTFDLVKELEKAVAGDTVSLLGDAVLSADAKVKAGVTLEDKGFSLTIPANVTLTVEGKAEITGKLLIDARGTVAVASGGMMTINNTDVNRTEVPGTLDVKKDGTLVIGDKRSSTFECLGTGRLYVEGTMKVGSGALNSAVHVRTGTITGTVQISDGSTFKIYDVLTIGSPPTLIEDLDNPASITGKFVLESTAYILVYGKTDFSAANNIRYSAVSTKFSIQGETYAAEYKDQTGKRTITLPSTSYLKDYRLIDWKDASGNVVTNASNIQIGGIDVVYGEVVKQTYLIILREDKSIKWVVNGIEKGSSGEEMGVYGATYVISIRPAQGTTEMPGILKDGMPFASGSSFVVTKNTDFATTSGSGETGSNILIFVLIGVGALIAVLAASVMIMKGKTKGTAKGPAKGPAKGTTQGKAKGPVKKTK